MPEVPIYTFKNPVVTEPSELRHFVTIQRASQTGDSFGKSINPVAWDVLYTTWAAIYTAGGREVAQASHIVSGVTHVIKVRYNTAVIMRANYRVVFGPRYFTVQYVENVKERNIVLLLYCIEIDGGGQ
jgi:SPP1 family predicted phage head-tail adaptor